MGLIQFVDSTRLKTSRLFPFALLSLAILCIYLPEILSHELVNWDDPAYIINNPSIKEFTVHNLTAAFKEIYVSNYAPLHIISYMIDYFFWGEQAQGYLLENVILHWINGLLLYTLLIRTTGSKFGAFIGTLIFLVHPVQIESVAWASERKNVLSLLFILSSTYYYLQFDNATTGKRWTAYLFSLLLFACAVLTKSIAVIFPALLFLYDHTMGRDSVRDWKLLEKLPFFVLSLAGILVTLISQDPELHQGSGGMRDLFQGDPSAKLLTMSTIYISYLRMIILPYDLSIGYSPDIIKNLDIKTVGCLISLVCIILLFAKAWRNDCRFAFWGGVFTLGLLPVSQIVPIITLMNDRYLYFPMIGVAGVIATTYVHLLKWKPEARYWTILCLVFFSAFLTYSATVRLKVWRNSTTLWTDAVNKNPTQSNGWLMLGEAHMSTGNYAASRQCLTKASELAPTSYAPLYTLASLAAKEGNVDQAVALLEKAIKAGFKNKAFLENDPIFLTLHGNQKFIRLCNYFYLHYYMPDYRSKSTKPYVSS